MKNQIKPWLKKIETGMHSQRHVLKPAVEPLSEENTTTVQNIVSEYMSGSQDDDQFTDQKQCAKSGCDNPVGREAAYCVEHRN